MDAALHRRGRLLGLRGSCGATWSATASSCHVAARVALASAVLFLVYPLLQWHAEQSLVVAEPGPVVTPVYGGLWENFTFYTAMLFALTLKYSASFPLHPVEYRVLDFSEDAASK